MKTTVLKKILIFVLNMQLLFCFNCSAQIKEYNFKNKSIFAEFNSTSLKYAINYEKIFTQQPNYNLSYSFGFSILKNAISLPISINYISGKYASHVQIGLGFVPFIEKYNNLFSGNNLSDKKMYIAPTIGYRYQQPNNSFYFKIAGGPYIYLDPPSNNFWKMETKIEPAIATCIGYSF
jgi:hypothetical protein